MAPLIKPCTGFKLNKYHAPENTTARALTGVGVILLGLRRDPISTDPNNYDDDRHGCIFQTRCHSAVYLKLNTTKPQVHGYQGVAEEALQIETAS